MSKRRLTLGFNTAITGLPPENGTFNESAHTKAVLPLRGLLMQIDGMDGVHIGRYGMTVTYLSELVDPQTILTRAQQAVDRLAGAVGSKLFPLREEKTPTVTMEQPRPASPTHRKTVVASLSSDLAAFTKDNDLWKALTDMLGKELASRDGVRGYEIYLREVRVTFDPRITSQTALTNHIRKVLNHQWMVSPALFPFFRGRVLRLKFTVIDE
jgi:hypothetical protein